MPTLEDDAPTIEPNEVEVGCGQAEVEKYWALVTSPVSYANLHKLLRAINAEAASSATSPATGLTNRNDDGLVIKSPKDY